MALSLSFESLLLSPQPRSPQMPPDPMRRQAVVSAAILPGKRGRVKYQATYWFAITPTSMPIGLKPGEKVRVIERRGNTLVVQPYQSSELS